MQLQSGVCSYQRALPLTRKLEHGASAIELTGTDLLWMTHSRSQETLARSTLDLWCSGQLSIYVSASRDVRLVATTNGALSLMAVCTDLVVWIHGANALLRLAAGSLLCLTAIM